MRSRSRADGVGALGLPADQTGRKSEVGRRKSPSPRSLVRRIPLLVLGSFLLGVSPAAAAERSVSDVVLVEQGAVIDDDLYTAGNRVVIEGRVTGDLIVAAYEDVTITGTVEGDVMGVAGSVIVAGTVGESVRVATPDLQVDGEVGQDVVALAWTSSLQAEIAGEVVLWAWSAEVGGRVGGDLTGQSRSLTLEGAVDGGVDVTVDRLEVLPGTVVGADLGYRSSGRAVGVEAAEVAGTVVHRLPLPPNIRVRALLILAKLVLGLTAAVAGLLAMWALPRSVTTAMTRVQTSWWRAWLRGLAVMAVPIVFLALAVVLVNTAPVEAAIPLLAVMVPLFLAVTGLVLAFGFVAPAAVFPWIGRVGKLDRGPVRAFLYGGAAVIVVALVPWLIGLVVLGVIPIGIGGWVGPGPERQPA